MFTTNFIRERMPLALGETNLPLPGKHSGKVRDWYDLDHGRRLLVTTDRLSASIGFWHVCPSRARC
jgi:hypothetical protein